jgi:hypothetical protein
MNERIKLLARRAGFDVERMEINHANGNPSMAEQFAELILQDCMSICEEQGDKGMDGHYCADAISKTFRS